MRSTWLTWPTLANFLKIFRLWARLHTNHNLALRDTVFDVLTPYLFDPWLLEGGLLHRYAEDGQVPGLFWWLVSLLTNPPALSTASAYGQMTETMTWGLSHPSTPSLHCCPHLNRIPNRARILLTHSANIHNVQRVPPTHCGSATKTAACTEMPYHLLPAGQTVLMATLLWNTGLHFTKKNNQPKKAELSKDHRNQTFSVLGVVDLRLIHSLPSDSSNFTRCLRLKAGIAAFM